MNTRDPKLSNAEKVWHEAEEHLNRVEQERDTLREQLSHFVHDRDCVTAELEALKEQLAEAREIVEPLANKAEQFDTLPESRNSERVTIHLYIPLGLIRKAAAFLSRHSPQWQE